MKKTINLNHPKIKYPRRIEAVKNELRKYIKRERRRELPEGVDFWDFDCRFGDTEAEAKAVHLAELDDYINDIEKRELQSFYVEILATSGVRAKGSDVQEKMAASKQHKPERSRFKSFDGN